MKNWTVSDIKEFGFKGFVKVSDLLNNYNQIPDERGVYLILKPETGNIEFLKIGCGGFFKQRNPNVAVDILKNKWIENSDVLYIGQAGGIRNGKWSDSTLRKRLKDYIKFGEGKPVGHSGGRYIWQINRSKDLIVCWKALPNKSQDPIEVESDLIKNFKTRYNSWPFANLKD
jgi:hypothetical protein